MRNEDRRYLPDTWDCMNCGEINKFEYGDQEEYDYKLKIVRHCINCGAPHVWEKEVKLNRNEINRRPYYEIDRADKI